jgi:phosphopantothenoylcysteine decarboxylase/phosphopantothenate--cysteine ligase
MGRALALAALRRGARVTVISGPCPTPLPRGARVVPVGTALQMRSETLRRWRSADVLIGAAAVGDWRFERVRRGKVKRRGAMTVRLVPNPDILAEIGRRRSRRPVLIGFALETGDEAANAAEKLKRKRLDLIVSNGPASLGSDKGRYSILDRRGRLVPLPAMTKERAAGRILEAAEPYLR